MLSRLTTFDQIDFLTSSSVYFSFLKCNKNHINKVCLFFSSTLVSCSNPQAKVTGRYDSADPRLLSNRASSLLGANDSSTVPCHPGPASDASPVTAVSHCIRKGKSDIPDG